MSTKPFVPEGSVFIEGRSEEKARELLELAEKAGLVGTVYTTSFGYIAPQAIFGEENKAAEFDPSAATIAEVQEYLDGADDTERERVLAAEAAGKGRKALVSATTEGDK